MQIKSTHSLLGNDDEQRERRLGKLFNEVNIIKEQVSSEQLPQLLVPWLAPPYSFNTPTLSVIIECLEKASHFAIVYTCSYGDYMARW